MRTAESVALPMDVFEKLYLGPQQPAAGQLRKTFGNPSPVALVGFLMCSTPLSTILMGWRGAGGGGAAILPVFIFFGGMLQIAGAIGEWLLGNTFPSVLFFTFDWNIHTNIVSLQVDSGLVQGTTLQPFYCVGGAYSPSGNCAEGATTPEYFATVGFYLISLTLVSSIFMICALRVNVVLLAALVCLVIAFGSLTGSYFNLALGNMASARKLEICAGAFAFILSILVWYLLGVQMMEAVDFPFTLPVGDLTSVVPGKSLRAPRRHQHSA